MTGGQILLPVGKLKMSGINGFGAKGMVSSMQSAVKHCKQVFLSQFKK